MAKNNKKVADYTITNEILGQGSFGKVKKAFKVCRDGSQEYFACKIVEKKNLSEQLLQRLKDEVDILKELTETNNKHIVKLCDVMRSSNNVYLFFEFANATDLENLKNARKRFSEQEAWLILRQLIPAFQQLYERQIIHRDLKLANVLIHFPEIPVEIPEEYHDDISARLEYMK